MKYRDVGIRSKCQWKHIVIRIEESCSSFREPARQNAIESLPESRVAQRVANWIHCAVDITQEITCSQKHKTRHSLYRQYILDNRIR